MDNLKKKTAKGLLWGGVSNTLQQLIAMVFGIALARMLSPGDYGMVGMLTIFSALAGALQEGGFISALNKRSHVSHADYNAVFWFNVLVSLFIYAILFLCAPLIAAYFHEPALVSLSRVVFAGFVVTSLNIVPRAYMFRELKVKQNALILLLAQLLSGLIGIVLVSRGLAYWGLAIQSLSYVSVITISCYAITRWKPSLRIRFQPIREMFGYSSMLILTNICVIVHQNIFPLILGRSFGKEPTGYFTQANKWQLMGQSTLQAMLYGVSQPVFAKTEGEPSRQLAILRKLLRFIAMVSFPVMLGLMLIAREFIFITLGAKWAESVGILQMLCLWGAVMPISTVLANYLVSRGKSRTFFFVTLSLCLLSLASIWLTAASGIDRMVQVFVGINALWLFVWHACVRRLTGLSVANLLRDILPYFLFTLAVMGATFWLTQGIASLWLSLLAKISLATLLYGGILYASGSVMFREALAFLFKKQSF